MEINKKEFHTPKQPIDLSLINVDQIVISDKFKHNDDGFIGYRGDDIVRPLCIIFPQMNGYIKYFKSGWKNISFTINDDSVLDKYSKTWNKIKKTLNVKFHGIPFYNEKYINAKVRESNGMINSVNFFRWWTSHQK